MAVHVCEIKVRFGETDAAGMVYFANYYKWMEYATNVLLNSIGVSIRQLIEQNRGLPVLEAKCEFKSPSYVEDTVSIQTRVEEVRTKSVRFAHEFYRDDVLLAKGYDVRIWVEFAEGKIRAAAIPEEIRSKLSSMG